VEDPSVRFELKNQKPVDLLDLTASLAAFGESYQDFIFDAGFDHEPGNVKFFVKEIRSGSIIADLVSVASQGSITLEHIDAAVAFVTHLNHVVQFFLGLAVLPPGERGPTKKDAEQIVKILEPVAKDGGLNCFSTSRVGFICTITTIRSRRMPFKTQHVGILDPQFPRPKFGMMLCLDFTKFAAA
jgi:hypothetical protein